MGTGPTEVVSGLFLSLTIQHGFQAVKTAGGLHVVGIVSTLEGTTMFTNLWKRPESATTPGFQLTVNRAQGAPLEFDGELMVESSGDQLPGYVAGDPFHHLLVYRLAESRFAVVIDFHASNTQSVTDAEFVNSLDEMDDFFCIHAADQFMQTALAPLASQREEKEREQRMLQRFDKQVLEVLRICQVSEAGSQPESAAELNDSEPPLTSAPIAAAESQVEIETD